MPYDAIAGRSVERLSALSDGVFSIARGECENSGELWEAPVRQRPGLPTRLISFLMLGLFRLSQGAPGRNAPRGAAS